MHAVVPRKASVGLHRGQKQEIDCRGVQRCGELGQGPSDAVDDGGQGVAAERDPHAGSLRATLAAATTGRVGRRRIVGRRPNMQFSALSRMLALLLLAGPLAAQQASPYVPLQHWAMPYVEHLIAAGVVRDPTPLTRPLRRDDLARALEVVDTVAAGPHAARLVARLLVEFRPPAATGDR